ILRWEQ
nr:Chain N, Peptide ILE-LEU-ARG-TRP-GLU-GLN [Trichoplusia ni]